MNNHLKIVRSWRASGLTFSAIQERCIEHGYTTQLGTTPTVKTICLWCKGIPKPTKRRRTRPYDPNTPPRTRLDQYPQNKGLRELIFELKSNGESLRSITAQLERSGFTTTKGTPIGKTQVLRIIQRASTEELHSQQRSTAAL